MIIHPQPCPLCQRPIKGNNNYGFLCLSCNITFQNDQLKYEHNYPENMIGLFLGRFQPFHNGHLYTVQKALKECERLKLVIGTIRISGTDENPYTVEQREKFINAALEEVGISERVDIFKIPDIPDNTHYVEYIKSHVGEFDRAYVMENKLNQRLFSEAGYPVIVERKFENINGTDIRKAIREGKQWKHLLPNSIVPLLEKIHENK